MSQEIVIRIVVPSGAVVSVEGSPARAHVAPLDDFENEPLPPEPIAFRGAATAQPMAQGVCPVHNQPWKTVPAGVSKTTGRPYEAFRACPERGCKERPAA